MEAGGPAAILSSNIHRLMEWNVSMPTIGPRRPSGARAARTLVTGGVRSGKSRYAEGLLADEPVVHYIAPGPVPDPVHDPEWAARVERHRARRPSHWVTHETSDVAAAVRGCEGAVIVDCLGTWLTAVIDRLGTWDAPLADWQGDFDTGLDDLVDAWRTSTARLVAVTNEVGLGVVPEHRSGRVFRDLLGMTNQRIADACDDVVLVIAGRALRLPAT